MFNRIGVPSVVLVKKCVSSLRPYACYVKMSVVSYNAAHHFSDDVLLMIFDQLEDEDLLRCESVCRQWRMFLLSGRPWRRLLHQQIVSSPHPRNILRSFGVDVKKLETVNYRSLCRAIIHERKQVDRNWRSGNFKKISVAGDFCFEFCSPHVTFGDDRNAVNLESDDTSLDFLQIVHRSNLQVISSMEIRDGSSAVSNTEIIIRWDTENIRILDINGQLISKVPELDDNELISWNLASCCLSRNQMAVLSQTDKQQKLSLWDVSDPLRATRLKSQHFNLDLQFTRSSSMKMDEHSIAVFTFQNETSKLFFFFKSTLQLHWQKTVARDIKNDFLYGHGSLIIKKNYKSEQYGIIQVYEVTSGQLLREMRIVMPLNSSQSFDFNAKFMVVAESNDEESELKIYDLEAVKNPKSTEDDLLVHSVAVKFEMFSMWMDETLLICAHPDKTFVLDFGSFELFGNEAKSVTLSLPWRSVWRSKGVDEEPLEPLHHIETYAEVVKYFHQLNMNCHKAMKTYPIEFRGTTSFLVGSDYIGYAKDESTWVSFDENMDVHYQEIDDNIHWRRISKITHISVINKTVQLIDIATGKVIQEVELEREMFDVHFNCDRLVFVSKIAEHEHVLSVWTTDNPLSLSHIKDVTIGDYNGSWRVDDEFIAVKTTSQENSRKTFNFISMKTFQVERSVSSRACHLKYDNGYLFLLNEGLVRILDVASGTFLQDIRMEPPSMPWKICANSNYVVIACSSSKLHVYDLNCLKETDSVPSHLLLTTIDLECHVTWMLINETRIVCQSYGNLHVVDLKPIQCLRCPESC